MPTLFPHETNGAGEALLRLEGVTKRWNGHAVLDEIDLEIHPGEVTGVAGGNGEGKTTLLRIACGVILPDEGTTLFRGTDIERTRNAFRSSTGLLSAGDRGLYARLSVSQNLDIWGGMAGMPRKRRRIRIADILSEFELEELADRRVERLSMGQRQRVRLAMAFLHEPSLVFLDEPRTSLDEAGVSLLAGAIIRMVDRGGSVLWVSPEADEPLVSTPWLLRDGKLHQLPGRAPALKLAGREAVPPEDPLTTSAVGA